MPGNSFKWEKPAHVNRMNYNTRCWFKIPQRLCEGGLMDSLVRWNLFDARKRKTRDVPSKSYERYFQRVNAFPGLSLIVRDANSFAENSESCRIDPIGIFPSVKFFLRETGIYRIERSLSAVIWFYSTNPPSLFLCLTIRLNSSTPGQKQTFPSNQLFPFAI